MPFRIPSGYEMLPVLGHDPSRNEVLDYMKWLRREQAVAEQQLALMPILKSEKFPSPKE